MKMAIFVEIFENIYSQYNIKRIGKKSQKFTIVIIFFIFPENGNLGLEIKNLKFLGTQPINITYFRNAKPEICEIVCACSIK